jgi:hypothetical protein
VRGVKNWERVQKDARNLHELSLITFTCYFYNLPVSEKITRKETVKVQLSRFGRELKSQQIKSLGRRPRISQKD